MERHDCGLDVSKDETATCVRRDDGAVVYASRTMTDPNAIFEALRRSSERLHQVVLETGRMSNWLHGELEARGLPVACSDARQAHAVLGRMHNKTAEIHIRIALMNRFKALGTAEITRVP